jgi:hypothetical protein
MGVRMMDGHRVAQVETDPKLFMHFQFSKNVVFYFIDKINVAKSETSCTG